MTIPHAQQLLLKAVDSNRLAAAYLITGSQAEERLGLAKFLAQALFCYERANGSPACGRCPVCRRVSDEKHPDLFIIQGEGVMSFLSIDQVRKLKSEIYLSPYQAPYRIYLLEIEAIREEAANAFLKTLEEPPRTAILVLLSRSEREFLPTIISRMARIRLPEPEITVSDVSDIKSIYGLSWNDPGEIFQLARGFSEYKEEDLKKLLEDFPASLGMALQFSEGLLSKDDVPEVIVKIAARLKNSREIRRLLEEVLAKRQDILRGRVGTRLALETLLISFSKRV